MIVEWCSLCISLSLVFAASPDLAAPDEVDAKTLAAIVKEIELVPSLYAKYPASLNPKPQPRFRAAKLAAYAVGKDQAVNKQCEAHRANRDQYTKEFPLRAAIFDAAEEMEKAKDLQIRMVVYRGLTELTKSVFMQQQAEEGITIFRLEQLLARLQELEKRRDNEKSQRWQANFDFARARLETNLIFLMEHNFALGRIRADALPEISPADEGWQVNFKPRIAVTEKKAKDLVKTARKRREKIQADHPDTPWAYFALQEKDRLIGMEWLAKKR